MDIIYIIFGIVILYLGGEALIKGVVSVARQLGVSQILVSSVIIGFGTSMPEMSVSVEAMLKNTPEIAVGNVIGSNIANILLILGISAMIAPFRMHDLSIKRDVIVMIIATIVFSVLGALQTIGFLQGILFLAILVTYIVYSYVQDKQVFASKNNQQLDIDDSQNLNFPLSIFLSLMGICLLVLGSSLFLDGAIAIANKLNISQEVIGLGIVSVGSCLPELVASIIASTKRQGDIIIASIVGSNIFNILSIMGVISMIDDIKIPQNMLKFDLWIFLSVTTMLSCMLLTRMNFSRKVGCLFCVSYSLYLLLLFN